MSSATTAERAVPGDVLAISMTKYVRLARGRQNSSTETDLRRGPPAPPPGISHDPVVMRTSDDASMADRAASHSALTETSRTGSGPRGPGRDQPRDRRPAQPAAPGLSLSARRALQAGQRGGCVAAAQQAEGGRALRASWGSIGRVA
jgi:hypothetical protein